MNTEKSVVWLVTYGVQLCPDTYYEKIHTFSTLMDGPKSMKLAETLALQRHVPEAFRKEPQGQWITTDGFRAFEYDENQPEIDAGAVYWIDEMRVVESADVAVVKKYLDSQPETWSQRHEEQLRLRGNSRRANANLTVAKINTKVRPGNAQKRHI
jgi:hypothetical protein